MDNETLATELLREVKASAKRWFILALVELVIILIIIASILVYFSLPVEDTTYTQTVEDITDSSNINQHIGDDNYGKSNTISSESTESNEKQ